MNTRKKTVGITLPQNLVEKARNHHLNISRIAEQALLSILDYMETQNIKPSSDFLTEGSFPKKPQGRVDQFGTIATLASWRSRVQIPARPPVLLKTAQTKVSYSQKSTLFYPESFNANSSNTPSVTKSCQKLLDTRLILSNSYGDGIIGHFFG